MTIAICLSGVPRTFLHTAPTIQSYFQDHKADLFLHLWEGEVEAPLLEQMKQAYKPQSLLFTKRPDAAAGKACLADRFAERPNPFSFDMFYATEQGVAAIPAGSYTHIVRARYDTIFDGRCPEEVFSVGPSTVVVPDNYTPPKGCNDQFAIGSEQAMRTYAGMYRWLSAHAADRCALPDSLFASNPSEFRPEQALMTYLSQSGLQVAQAPLSLTLLREADVGKPFSDLPQDVHQGINVSYEAWKAIRDRQALGQPVRQALVRCAPMPKENL